MEKRILLTVAYDGSDYFGWQAQKNPEQPTVQEALQAACEALFGQPVECTGASRTDRGVHALGQRGTIWVDTSIPAEKIPFALNTYLPESIAVTAAEAVPEGFHPRYDVKDKLYRFRIYNAPHRNPLLRKYAEWVCRPLDAGAMHRAAQALVGRHDFAAFRAMGSAAKTTVRTIFEISVERREDEVQIFVRGDGFLYNMVRIIAGTLIAVGQGKMPEDEVARILASKDRTRAGKTAGPEGLTLMEIRY